MTIRPEDVVWHEGIINGNTASCTIQISAHNNIFGMYRTHVYAYDKAGNFISAAYNDIDIKDIAFPQIESNVLISNQNKNIISTFYNILEPCDLIIVLYKDDRMVDFTIQNNTAYLEYNTTLDIDKVKVMVWNSLSGLKPLCEAEVIPSSEFIIE